MDGVNGDNCDLQVFYGIPFKKRDRILTSVIEYGANYIAFLQVSHVFWFLKLSYLGYVCYALYHHSPRDGMAVRVCRPG